MIAAAAAAAAGLVVGMADGSCRAGRPDCHYLDEIAEPVAAAEIAMFAGLARSKCDSADAAVLADIGAAGLRHYVYYYSFDLSHLDAVAVGLNDFAAASLPGCWSLKPSTACHQNLTTKTTPTVGSHFAANRPTMVGTEPADSAPLLTSGKRSHFDCFVAAAAAAVVFAAVAAVGRAVAAAVAAVDYALQDWTSTEHFEH